MGSMLFGACTKDAKLTEKVQPESNRKISTLAVDNAPIDAGASTLTKNLYFNLKEVAFDTHGILFGQEFFNSQSFAIDPQDNPAVSDFKTITTDQPAVLGQDLQWYLTKPWELSRMKAAALHVYNNGGVVTMDFHMNSKYATSTAYNGSPYNQWLMYNIGNNTNASEVAWFDGQLQQACNVLNDLKIPVVVRLFHEMNGNWFWWGNLAGGGAAAYQKMYQHAVNYMKANTNYALFGWSPNSSFNSGTFPGTNYYPGDAYVDVVGVDMYDAGATGNSHPLSDLAAEVTAVSDFAYNHAKIPVLSEVGNRVDNPNNKPNWWYDVNTNLQTSASGRAYKIAWMLTWVNKPWGGNGYPYVAYSGSNSAAKTGLINFKNMSTTLTMADSRSRNMYDTSYKQ